MKAAFWGIGLILLGVFAIVMIDLFGNITVTNQLNYTTMKNAVEASMQDAIDMSYYSSGFCVCSTNTSDKKISFTDSSQYELVDIKIDNDGKETCSSTKKCEILHGEYRINKKVFSESLIRRFSEIVNNNKAYEMVIQEIIEYPPKVSVRINSQDDNFFPTDPDSGGFTIVNQMDSIIETWNGLPTPMPAPKIKCYNPTYNGGSQTIAKCSGGKFTKVENKYLETPSTSVKKTDVGEYKLLCENEDAETTKTCEINSPPPPPPDDGNNGGPDGGGDDNNNGGGDCKWFYFMASQYVCKDANGKNVQHLDGLGYSPVIYDDSGKAMYSCKVDACGSTSRYVSGCSALRGYDYKVYSSSATLHTNQGGNYWCVGKIYHTCYCVNSSS